MMHLLRWSDAHTLLHVTKKRPPELRLTQMQVAATAVKRPAPAMSLHLVHMLIAC